MNVIIGSDHGGYDLKKALTEALTEWGIEHHDVGCHDRSSVDYPDLAHEVSAGVADGRYEFGVLVCGTGIGMSIAANRHRGIRAALCADCYTAEMTRAHNDANVLCLGGRVVGPGLAIRILKIFLDGTFEGGRHSRRIDKMDPEKA